MVHISGITEKEKHEYQQGISLKTPEMPIFRTLDSAQHLRAVYAFYCLGELIERDTLEQAQEARAQILERYKRG